MAENTQRHFSADPAKLHSMLDRKTAELDALTAEVEELRRRVTEADHHALTSTADEFNVTPNQFKRFVEAMQSGLIPDDLMALITTEPDPPPVKKIVRRSRKQTIPMEEKTNDDDKA